MAKLAPPRQLVRFSPSPSTITWSVILRFFRLLLPLAGEPMPSRSPRHHILLPDIIFLFFATAAITAAACCSCRLSPRHAARQAIISINFLLPARLVNMSPLRGCLPPAFVIVCHSLSALSFRVPLWSSCSPPVCLSGFLARCLPVPFRLQNLQNA